MQGCRSGGKLCGPSCSLINTGGVCFQTGNKGSDLIQLIQKSLQRVMGGLRLRHFGCNCFILSHYLVCIVRYQLINLCGDRRFNQLFHRIGFHLRIHSGLNLLCNYGVHLPGWMKGTVRTFWKRKLGCDWEKGLNTPEFWTRVLDPEFISDEEIWAMRHKLKREMIEFSRRRLLLQGERLGPGDFIAFDHLLSVDALTIGFARRFATYKRAPLIFQQFERIVELVKDRARPIQFVFAGKAHPRDDEGKKLIQRIIHLSRFSELSGRLIFISNYDIHVARQMVSGCDVWLNNPRRPLEASGTSGMKTCTHGCLNLSILDGWWREGYDGTNGFAIGDDSHPDSIEEQDRRDSENLFQVLTEEVIPCYYNRSANGIPRAWIQKIRRAMATLTPQFNTWRMVQEYTQKYYLRPAKQ